MPKFWTLLLKISTIRPCKLPRVKIWIWRHLIICKANNSYLHKVWFRLFIVNNLPFKEEMLILILYPCFHIRWLGRRFKYLTTLISFISCHVLVVHMYLVFFWPSRGLQQASSISFCLLNPKNVSKSCRNWMCIFT